MMTIAFLEPMMYIYVHIVYFRNFQRMNNEPISDLLGIQVSKKLYCICVHVTCSFEIYYRHLMYQMLSKHL